MPCVAQWLWRIDRTIVRHPVPESIRRVADATGQNDTHRLTSQFEAARATLHLES